MHYWSDIINKGLRHKPLVLPYYTLFGNCWLDVIDKGIWHKSLVLSYFVLFWNYRLTVINKGIWHKPLVLSFYIFWNHRLNVINKGIRHKPLVLSYYELFWNYWSDGFNKGIWHKSLILYYTLFWKLSLHRLESQDPLGLFNNRINHKFNYYNATFRIPFLKTIFMIICGASLIFICRECLSILGNDKGEIGIRRTNGTPLMSHKEFILKENVAYFCPHIKYGICSPAKYLKGGEEILGNQSLEINAISAHSDKVIPLMKHKKMFMPSYWKRTLFAKSLSKRTNLATFGSIPVWRRSRFLLKGGPCTNSRRRNS